jgi:hypothetical protein
MIDISRWRSSPSEVQLLEVDEPAQGFIKVLESLESGSDRTISLVVMKDGLEELHSGIGPGAILYVPPTRNTTRRLPIPDGMLVPIIHGPVMLDPSTVGSESGTWAICSEC